LKSKKKINPINEIIAELKKAHFCTAAELLETYNKMYGKKLVNK